MCLKQGMAWSDPLNASKRATIEELIQQAGEFYKRKHGRWPNFVRVSPADAERLGGRLNGLLVIADAGAGKAYRLLMGWSGEALAEMEKAA
jgi:hypothetical protein